MNKVFPMFSMDGFSLMFGTQIAEHTCMPGTTFIIYIHKASFMKTVLIVIAASILVSGSCRKRKGALIVPDSLIFIIKQNGQRLDDNTLNNMKLYYWKAGVKTYMNDFVRGINEGTFNAFDLGVQTTRQIGNVSGDDKIKDFYLEFQSGYIDTLYVDYQYIGEAAYDHPCYCYYPMGVVKYNGVIASPDPSITVQKVFRFDKL